MPVLQSLRGIFALFIFFHHLSLFEAGGDAGVCFYLILSGFVLSAGYFDRMAEGKVRYQPFMKRRFLRIYPFHLIGFVAAVVLVLPRYGQSTLPIYLSNLLLVQSWIPVKMFFFSVDAPSWYLSDILFCYLLFPLIVRLLSRLSRIRNIGFFCVLIIIYFSVLIILPESLCLPLLYINPLFRLLDFIIGILLWRIVRNYQQNESYIKLPGRLPVSALQFLVTAFYIFSIFAYYTVPARFGYASYWWIPTVLLIIICTIRGSEKGLGYKLLANRLFVAFGDISFAFYVLHYPFIAGYVRLARKISWLPQHQSAGGIAIILVLTIIFSTLVTNKLMPRINGILSRRRVLNQ